MKVLGRDSVKNHDFSKFFVAIVASYELTGDVDQIVSPGRRVMWCSEAVDGLGQAGNACPLSHAPYTTARVLIYCQLDVPKSGCCSRRTGPTRQATVATKNVPMMCH